MVCLPLADLTRNWVNDKKKKKKKEKFKRNPKAAEKGISDLGSDLTESQSQGPFENPYLEI